MNSILWPLLRNRCREEVKAIRVFKVIEKIQSSCYPFRLGAFCLSLALFSGCAGIPTAKEKQARQDQESVRSIYRPDNRKPSLPKLTTESKLADFMVYAMLNEPSIEGDYYEWMASVERITGARSLPDPKLTFETDIQDAVLSLVAGFMVEFPVPAKLGSRAEMASEESYAKYFAFKTSVLQTAFDLKQTYYQLFLLEEKLRVNREVANLLKQLESLAEVSVSVGKTTIQDVLRAQIEREQLLTEIKNLEDSRKPLMEKFKATLGISADQADPSIPKRFETASLDLQTDKLLKSAFEKNPRIQAMEAEVRRAEAAIKLAYQSQWPEFSVGLEADAEAVPTMFTPQLGITLPIWRDKITAEIREAQANKNAAEARLSAEQINVTVEIAEKTFMYREASRVLHLLQEKLLLKAKQSLDVAQSGYTGGKFEFLNVIDAERTLLTFKLTEAEARTKREIALAELSTLILGQPPISAPLLESESKLREVGKNK